MGDGRGRKGRRVTVGKGNVSKRPTRRERYKKERHEDENVIIIKGDWGHHKRDEIWEKSGWAGEGKEAMRLEMNRPRAVEEILVFCSLQFSTEKTFF